MKDFNFLPRGYREDLRKRKTDVWIQKIIIPYSVVVALMVLVPIGINLKLNYDKGKIQSEVSNETYYRNKSDQYKILQNIYRQREEQATNLMDYGIDPTNVIDDLQKVMPDNVYIEYLNIRKLSKGVFNIQMRCVAKTKEDAATFLEVLRKDSKYYEAGLTSFDEVQGRDTVEFTFSCTYKEEA